MVHSRAHIFGCDFLGDPSPAGDLKRKSQPYASGKKSKRPSISSCSDEHVLVKHSSPPPHKASSEVKSVPPRVQLITHEKPELGSARIGSSSVQASGGARPLTPRAQPSTHKGLTAFVPPPTLSLADVMAMAKQDLEIVLAAEVAAA